MKTIRILILEDDLKTLSVIMDKLFDLEEQLYKEKKDIAVTVFSEYIEVESYLNQKETNTFDLILLDKDCKLTGSFHCLDFEKFNPDKIIAISSVANYNEKIEEMGVKRICRKDFTKLDEFGDNLIKEIREIVNKINL